MIEYATTAQMQEAIKTAHEARGAMVRGFFKSLFTFNSTPLAPFGLTATSR